MSDHHATPTSTRDALRARLRGVRDGFSAERQRLAAEAAAARLAGWAPWAGATTIGVYRAAGGELDPSFAADAARARGATTFVPVLAGDELRFAPYDADTAWRPNRYGIDEPADATSVSGRSLDVVLVPAVGVDRRGNRLGMGAGWYDRTFRVVDADEPGPRLVAFVHTAQVLDAIASQPWDVPVSAVVTPDDVIEIA